METDDRFVDRVTTLIADADSGRASLHDFERRFLTLHSDMPIETPDDQAETIERLFWAVDSWVPDASLRTADDIDDTGLREAISAAREALTHHG